MIITLLDVLSFVVEWAYALLFFWILHTFLPVRKPWPLRLAAVVVCAQLSVVVIYSNDLPGLLGAMMGFFGYVAVFHRGRWMKKVAAVLVFYPALIAVNYLMQDAGSNLFFAYTGAPGEPGPGWTESDWFWSTLIHTLSLLARLGFWVGAWAFLRRKLKRIAESLTAAMWWMVDAVMLAPFVCIFIIIYFMPEEMAIVYPVCFASIFSSFGCIYVAAYICDSLQDRYRAQALEKQQAYYKDRLRDEERVRSIYHDMKNHLLVLQAQTGGSQALHQAAQDLQVQLEAYESYQHTGNEYLDIVLRDKAKAAREKGIDFTAVTPFADGRFLAPPGHQHPVRQRPGQRHRGLRKAAPGPAAGDGENRPGAGHAPHPGGEHHGPPGPGPCPHHQGGHLPPRLRLGQPPAHCGGVRRPCAHPGGGGRVYPENPPAHPPGGGPCPGPGARLLTACMQHPPGSPRLPGGC